jgi:hypothetical protein
MADAAQTGRLDLTRRVVEVAGQLGPSQSAELNEILHSLTGERRVVQVHLPDATQLPPGNLAACVFAARRLANAGGKLVLVAGPGVADSIRRAHLSWLLPVDPLPAEDPLAVPGIGDTLVS